MQNSDEPAPLEPPDSDTSGDTTVGETLTFDASKPASEPPAGVSHELRRLGDYQLETEIGRGGQGVVYRATDLRLRRKVALKVLNEAASASMTMRRRLQREAEAASRLDHPGICAVYDLGQADGIPYIAMRHVEGESLAARIQRLRDERLGGGRRTTPSAASTSRDSVVTEVELVEKIARALHVAHEAGLVHRDIKPGNVMVAKDGEPVILDFGLARDEHDDQPAITLSGQMLGTPAYMAPEQIAAERIIVDRRADVYALGVILFESLTLQRPFEAPTRDQLYHQILVADPPNPTKLNRAISTDLRVVVEAALEKNRDRRYQTALDLAEDLRRIRSREPIVARPIGPIGRWVRYAVRHPARAALFAILIVGLPLLAVMAARIIANRPIIAEQQRQALLAAVEGHLQDGYDELDHGDRSRAVIAFDDALALRRDTPEAIGGKAMALLRQGKYAAGLAFLTANASRVDGVSALMRLRIDALTELGRTGEARDVERNLPEPETALDFFLEGARLMDGCETQRDPTVLRRAIDFFRRAELTTPHARFLYHSQLAHAAGHLDDARIARPIAHALTTMWPESVDAWYWAAYALNDVDPVRAIAAYEKALRLKPDHDLARENLSGALSNFGITLRLKGQLEEAMATYEKAIELDPTAAIAHTNLGLVLIDQRKLDEAIVALNRAVELQRDSVATYHPHAALGYAFLHKRDPDRAIVSFRRAIDLDPDAIDAYGGLAKALRAKGELDQAIAAYDKMLELEPEVAETHNSRGIIFMMKGEVDQAIRAFQNAIQWQPKYALAHGNLGIALSKKGDLNAAVAAFEKVLALQPDSGSARSYYNLANVLLQQGELDRAIEAFEKAIERQPDHAAAHCNLAKAYRQKGAHAASLRHFRRGHAASRALQSWRYPSDEWVREAERRTLRQAQQCATAGMPDGGDGPDPKKGASRETARDLVREVVAGWGDWLGRGLDEPARVRKMLAGLKRSAVFAKFGDPAFLAGLAESERAAWRELWALMDEVWDKVKDAD